MKILKVRKNFLLDQDAVEKAAEVLKKRHQNFTGAVNHYFRAIAKDPSILDTVEEKATARTGNFIGILDGKIGDKDYKSMKKTH